MQKMTPVIILDGHLKSALAVVRSLGKQNIPIVIGSDRWSGMALHSKYASNHFVYPSPGIDCSAFIRYVKAEAVRLHERPVVYTLSEETTTALFAHHEELLPYIRFVYPCKESVEIVCDKAATYSFAKVHGVPTVESYLIFVEADLERQKNTFSYPLVIKPRRSITWKENRGTFGTAQFIFSFEELKHVYSNLSLLHGEPPLVQKCTEGDEYGVELLARKGKPYALTAHKRLRSMSPTGGASVLKETIASGDLYHEIETNALQLCEALAWEGPVMFEFKVDADTRKPLLMEINGRFWGSLPLSIFAGVDMPYLYYKACVAEEIPQEIVRGRENVVSRHFLGDMRHLLRVIFMHDRMRSRIYPKRLRALSDFFHVPKGTYTDVWDNTDMAPALFEVFDIIKKRLWK